MADYQLAAIGVIRTKDGLHIPNDPRNRDWRKFQAWLRAGGVPDPEPTLPVMTDEDRVELAITGTPELLALVRRLAAKEGITEREFLDEIRAEASK